MIINSPQNPTGIVYTEKTIEMISKCQSIQKNMENIYGFYKIMFIVEF